MTIVKRIKTTMSKSANNLFKVGEVALGQGFVDFPECNGMEYS